MCKLLPHLLLVSNTVKIAANNKLPLNNICRVHRTSAPVYLSIMKTKEPLFSQAGDRDASEVMEPMKGSVMRSHQ